MKRIYHIDAGYPGTFIAVLAVMVVIGVSGCQTEYPKDRGPVKIGNEQTSAAILDDNQNVPAAQQDIAALELSAFELMNKKRAEDGLKPLVWNADLANVARKHSGEMAEHDFFSVKPYGGKTIGDQAAEFGIKDWKHLGRMVAAYTGVPNPVETAIERWLSSKERKQYLFDGRWQETGVGIFVSKAGKLYLTEDFLSK